MKKVASFLFLFSKYCYKEINPTTYPIFFILSHFNNLISLLNIGFIKNLKYFALKKIICILQKYKHIQKILISKQHITQSVNCCQPTHLLSYTHKKLFITKKLPQTNQIRQSVTIFKLYIIQVRHLMPHQYVCQILRCI